jgi:hypothetical protein
VQGLDCTSGDEPGYFVRDLNGDGRPDLVVTDECNTGGGGDVGELHWLVYPNTGSGFAAVPAQWPIPGGLYPGDETFDLASAGTSCVGAQRPAWDTFDIDADGLPELVVTESCTDTDVGELHWLVFDNTGTGFDSSPYTWEIPGADFSGAVSLPASNGDSDCGGTGRPTSRLADLDADGDLDLLITEVCGSSTVGETEWLWYKNLGDAFAPSAGSFGLPGANYLGTGNFLDTEAGFVCNGLLASPSFSLVDLDGDRRLDLAVTDECDSGGAGVVGEQYWRVFFNAGVRFQEPGVEWDVPGARYAGNETFELLAQAQDCGGANAKPLYATVDLDGNRLPDLFVLDECDSGGAGNVGERWWLVFTNTGSGFSATPTNWLLPGASFTGNESLDTLGESSNCTGGSTQPAYSVVDLDGDRQASLVVTDVCNDTVVGESEWTVYDARPFCRP